MSPYVGLFFDVVITVALGVAIFLAVRLSRQMDAMRAEKKVFETLISALNLASSRAEASIRSFKETAVGGGDALQDKINRARGVADELEIVIQAGDSLADRLQELAGKSRAVAGTKEDTAPAAAPRPPEPPAGGEPRTRAEKELLEAMRAHQLSQGG